MPPVVAPIEPGQDGPAVAALQDALLSLLDHDAIRVSVLRDLPTSEQLAALEQGLNQDRVRAFFGDATTQLVMYFQSQEGLDDNLRGVVEERTATKLNEWLKSVGELDNPPRRAFVLRGRVVGATAGQIVRAFDEEFRGHKDLGDSPIDALGNYQIPYAAKQFRPADRGTADLRVALFEGDREVLSSEIHYNAAPEITIDLEIGGGPVTVERSEYERYLADLEVVMREVTLIEIDREKHADRERDLDFLTGDTGIDRQHIAWLVTAAGFEEASKHSDPEIRVRVATLSVPAEAFYAWFRQGLPANLDELFALPIDSLKDALDRSLTENTISAGLADRIDIILADWSRWKAIRALQAAPEGKRPSLGDLLRTIGREEALTRDQQLVFAKLRTEHGDRPELWEGVEAAGLARAVPILKRTMALDELTAGHGSLVQALQSKADRQRPESLAFLTALEPRDWIGLVFEHGVPPGSDLDHNAYVEQLQTDVERRFPTPVLATRLAGRLGKRKDFPTESVLGFLNANPEFDLRKRHVEPFLIDSGSQDDQLREGLLRLQRVHTLAGDARETTVLLEAGFGSATQVVQDGMPAFERRLAPLLPPARLRAIFSTAERVVASTVALGTAYGSSAISPNSIAVVPAPPVPSAEVLNRYPSLRTLFGDLDYCECRHCRSVLGPAAYLADLLHFLQRSPLSPNADGHISKPNFGNVNLDLEVALAQTKTVIGALLKRRPDLADLELSCENANTEIPYIDLVLEILENAVGLPLTVDPSEYSDADVSAALSSGKIPVAVADALDATDIKVGANLTVEKAGLPTASPFFDFDQWIIKDGSRRWSLLHLKAQLACWKLGGGIQPTTVLDLEGAVNALEQGRLNEELEGKLSLGLAISGTPVVQAIGPSATFVKAWGVKYTRAIAVRITITAANVPGAVEVLKPDGTVLRSYSWPVTAIQQMVKAFTAGATARIGALAAQLLEVPSDEPYVQIWNPIQNWWELSIETTAALIHVQALAVTGLTYQNSSVRGQDLKASPENRNPAAYRKLASKAAVFPWALPFDLWLEEARAFLEGVGVPRSRLIEMARPQARLSDEAAILELLGISKSEAEVLASAGASSEPWTYWGLTEENNNVQDHVAGAGWAGDWLSVLSHVSMLLQQSGLTYREYLDFRQTRVVGQTKGVLLPPGECRTSKLVLAGLDTTQLASHLKRIHLFTRLWRRSGFTMRDLDEAIAAFDAKDSAAVLKDLALLKRVSAAAAMPVSAVLGCIAELGTHPWTDHIKEGSPVEVSLYDSVFQRQALRSLAGFADFSLDSVSNTSPSLMISDRADFIAASLGLKAAQVNAWIGSTLPGLNIDDTVTLANLSRLYAAASLCRGLGIAPEALASVIALLGDAADPFRQFAVTTTSHERARVRAGALLELVERVGVVRRAGLDFDGLSYLLRHATLPGTSGVGSARLEQQLTQTLVEVRSALQTGDVLGDSSVDNLKRQLARLGWYPALIDELTGERGMAYQPRASVEITSPPTTPPVIPLNLRTKFIYEQQAAAKATLTCVGPLGLSDFAGIGANSLFPAALIDALEDQYKQNLKVQGEALAGLLQRFDLETLPKEIEAITSVTFLPLIPGDLAGRLVFDLSSPTAGTLSLTGWLTDDDVTALSKAAPALAGAARTLQTAALGHVPVASMAVLAEVDLILLEPDLAKRSRAILSRLVSRLEVDVVASQLGGAFGLDQGVARRLLDLVTVGLHGAGAGAPIITGSARQFLMDAAFLSSEPKSVLLRKDWRGQFATLELFHKIATTVDRLTIRPEQVDWILGAAFPAVNVLALPTSATPADKRHTASFDEWHQLIDLFQLRDALPDGPTRLTRISKALETADLAAVRNEFSEAFDLTLGDVENACSADRLDFKSAASENDYANPSRLLALAQLLHVIKALGTTAIEVGLLTRSATDQSDAAQIARQLFAANTKSDALAERMRPISNRLRKLQRDALVTYLVHREGLADSNDLFDRYLIDVEMGPCMVTSRIKQAISSLQLFVQRCLLNLERAVRAGETGVSPAAIDSQRWQWMKHYRVWEANRKVFLYPENWIEPELRDDKSDIFRTFESDLLQSEITHDSALLAFRKYVDNLANVANLTVVSMFDDGDGIVHFVGRDNSQPYKHYYRQWKVPSDASFGTWTAWEEISAQVDSDHVLLFVFGGSVYLAWPTISSGRGDKLRWTIGMNLAKRSASGWTKLKRGRGDIETPMVPSTDERTALAFRIGPIADTVSLVVYGSRDQDTGLTPREPNGPKVEGYDFRHPTEGQEKIGNQYANNPFVILNLRALAAYTYEYAGHVTRTHYGLPDSVPNLSPALRKIDISVKVTAATSTPKGGTGGTFEDTRSFRLDPTANNKVEALIKSQFVAPEFKPTETRLIDVTKIEVSVTLSSAYKPLPSFPRVFYVEPGSSLTWSEDFVFELQDDPGWLPSGDGHLVKVGGYRLKDDDSLELEAKPQPAATQQLRAETGTETFMSGYREIGVAPLFMLDPSLQALGATKGQYFIAQAAGTDGDTASPPIYAYRDDAFSLLFWRGQAGAYRTVPFSTGGLVELASAVTKGRMLDAVRLPLVPLLGSLTPTTIPAVGFGPTSETSLTEIGIDFEHAPSSIYNWEVFFHNPLLVATQLSRAQRFEEAQRWFHLIFDPTTDEPAPAPNSKLHESARYWRFQPFRKAGQGYPIETLLEASALGSPLLSDAIKEWSLNPFRPHLVARQRLRSYQFAVVQKYLENLVAWGDQLFTRDTIESINEATQLYVLAARLLGQRPADSPKSESSPRSYRDIQARLDAFSNAWVSLEPLVGTQSLMNTHESDHKTGFQDLSSLGSLYFCIPGNDKLLEYWDTVDDRLFKIRHCMNIEGIERRLPLFEPPIDPALLVKATAAGLDIAAVLSDLGPPLPGHRFSVVLQKALELCSEVRALGNALLSVLEKKDAEHLSLLRSGHEIQMLKLVTEIKEQQKKEAESNLEALRKTRAVAAQRYVNYQRLMGKQNAVAPAEGTTASLESSTLQLAPPSAGDADTEGLALISAEAGHMGWLNDANNFSLISGSHNVLAGVLHIIPDFIAGASIPAAAQTKFGGSNLGSAIGAAGAAWGMLATNASFQAGRSATIGGHQRRFDEWRFQSNTAGKELEQIDKQILASTIRKEIAEREIANHDEQIENAQEVEVVMRDKFTSEELYSWMVGQISSVYFRTYKLAHDVAKRAERTFRFELGLDDSSFIEFGYWDSLKKGLLSGERLYLDLKRMDLAYLDQNKREYEITKHVSLEQLDPMALLLLKETGQCELNVPEVLLDMDFPGHYLRRIRTVSLTIPCVTGPYTGVPCTLTLLKHSIRRNTNASGGYARDAENDDPRFVDAFGAVQSIVTSSAQNDSGLFETNLRDERYLPFEGAGVISTWSLELPRELRPFDYSTISDVVLHVRYTAREGGGILRQASEDALTDALNTISRAGGQAGLVRLFSLRHEFPNEWQLLKTRKNDTTGAHVQAFSLNKQRFPFMFLGRPLSIASIELCALPKDGKNAATLSGMTMTTPTDDDWPFKPLDSVGAVARYRAADANDKTIEVKIPGSSKTDADWTIEVGQDDAATTLDPLEDILLLCHYSVGAA